MCGYCLPDAGKRWHGFQLLRFYAAAVKQYRYMFTRMVTAFPGRVATMVCGNKQQIVLFKLCQYFRQAAVKIFQRFAIPQSIAPVSVRRIKIYKVAENQRVIRSICNGTAAGVKNIFQPCRRIMFGYAAVGKISAILPTA